MEKFEFKLWSGKRIKDIKSYLTEYFDKNETDRIYIGCDSQNVGKKTKYAVAICLYSEMLQKGAHVIYVKDNIPRIDEHTQEGIQRKLWGESERVYEVAEFLQNELADYALENWSEYKDGDRICEIHLDYNPIEGRRTRKKYRENKSSKLLGGSVNWLKACGYIVKTKPIAWAASYAADKLCR